LGVGRFGFFADFGQGGSVQMKHPKGARKRKRRRFRSPEHLDGLCSYARKAWSEKFPGEIVEVRGKGCDLA